eukprot:scaffold83789_cov63-Phaeocystis_antarctica.AAC.2
MEQVQGLRGGSGICEHVWRTHAFIGRACSDQHTASPLSADLSGPHGTRSLGTSCHHRPRVASPLSAAASRRHERRRAAVAWAARRQPRGRAPASQPRHEQQPARELTEQQYARQQCEPPGFGLEQREPPCGVLREGRLQQQREQQVRRAHAARQVRGVCARRAESRQAAAPPGAGRQTEQQRTEHEVCGKRGIPCDARGRRAARAEVAVRKGRERRLPHVGGRAGAEHGGEPGGGAHVGGIEEHQAEH